MDRLDAMEVLLAVVETGSFSAASRRMGMPLPTVSRKVSELEAHLNTRLLIRSTRKLNLTDAGADYVASARRILDEVGEAERTAAGEYTAPRGELVVTAPIVFGRLHVLPVITEFLMHYSEIDVRLALSDRNAHLIDDHIDVAVRIGALPDSTLRATRVGHVRRIVCASPGFLARHGEPKNLGDLSGLACITFDMLGARSEWRFMPSGSKNEQTVPIRSRLVVNTAEAAIDAAIAGLGVTRVLSYQATDALAQGQLQIVLSDCEPSPLPVSLLHAGQGLQPLKMRSFIDFAAPRLREGLVDVSRL